MFLNHPVETSHQVTELMSLIEPHLEAVDLKKDVTDRMETLHAMAELDGGEVTDFTKQLMVLVEKELISHVQVKKLLIQRYVS